MRGTVGTVAAKTAYRICQGLYERDYGSFIVMQRGGTPLLKVQLVSSAQRTTPGGIVVIPNTDVCDFTPVQYPADDVTAEWQGDTLTTISIGTSLKLDVLGYDDPTMIRACRTVWD